MRRFVLDTGPLVAYLDSRDAHHRWTRRMFDEARPPLITCEPVLTEALHLMRMLPGSTDAVLALVERGVVAVTFRFEPERAAVGELMRRFGDVPMSFADACLVRMTEMESDVAVLTLDGDFRVYRRHRRKVVPTAMPA